jgi:hypothetical protein
MTTRIVLSCLARGAPRDRVLKYPLEDEAVPRIKITDLVLDEALDATALKWIWGGRDRNATRPRGLVTARDLPTLLDRALMRRPQGEKGRRP